MKRSLLIPVSLTIILGAIGVIAFMRNRPQIAIKPTRYTLDKQLNSKIVKKHPYLQNLQQVSFWETYYQGKKVIAKSSKVLDKKNFVELVGDFVDYGYVQQGGWNQKMEIKDREIVETEAEIVILDRGVNAVYNDTPPFGTSYSEIGLTYRYLRNDGEIFFEASMPEE